ncbi:uncharacterized protein LY89DRAFT_719976 [Mollisia scopiformis]|uniref:Uncharacterized protein n=1 Tax=Mollisia scopiformis TaxID=149040 RepID=A0A194X5G7_MOLSC|nr:uncharacterized protein LY89DRAFT_719976 [Mollisia scopiformis]KUJ15423.1 hypothetical protein LY89DRAFT_719976 [Mollisia scopiformis]
MLQNLRGLKHLQHNGPRLKLQRPSDHKRRAHRGLRTDRKAQHLGRHILNLERHRLPLAKPSRSLVRLKPNPGKRKPNLEIRKPVLSPIKLKPNPGKLKHDPGKPKPSLGKLRHTFTEPQSSNPRDTRTNPRQTFTPPTQSYTQPQQTYTPPFRTTNYNPPPPFSTTYTSVYFPNPPQHTTHHRSENSYTTIYISVGNPTTYVQPIFVQPTYYWPPPTITLAPEPVTYTTVYVYPDTDSDLQTYYSTVTTYVVPSQETSTTYVYQTYVPPPATTAQRPGAEPTAGVNPWAGSCPVASDFIVHNFVSNSGGVSLSISYNGGTFNCPNTPTNEVTYNGMNDMYCDDDGLVRVITDGATWLWISEWSWCSAVPATAGNMPTLEAATNYTNFGYYALDCTTGSTGIQSCTQAVQNFAIPVVSFGLGGAIGFEPLDINGNYLPGCPSVTNTQPIVTNTATCSAVQTQTTGLTTVTIIS